MPGQYRYSIDMLSEEIKAVQEAGVNHVILFGIPFDEDHDACGSSAHDPNGIVQRAIREIKEHSDIFVTTMFVFVNTRITAIVGSWIPTVMSIMTKLWKFWRKPR